MKAALFRLVALAATASGLAACPSSEPPAAVRPCCDQPAPAAGAAPFQVVADEVSGPSDAQKVHVRAGLTQPAKRGSLFPALHSLYRHAMQRGPFEPIDFVADLYDSPQAAQQAGATGGSETGLVARISRSQSERGPRCENRVAYDFAEQVERAFAATTNRLPEEDSADTCHIAEPKRTPRPDEGFKHRPAYQVDLQRHAVIVTFPYLEMGKDEYAASINLNRAMGEWIDTVTSMFRKVPDLKEISYSGIWNDTPVLGINVTRADFEAKFRGLQEDIAAHSAVTFASLGTKHLDDKGAAREQDSFRNKTYKQALAALPRSQVTVSPKLK